MIVEDAWAGNEGAAMDEHHHGQVRREVDSARIPAKKHKQIIWIFKGNLISRVRITYLLPVCLFSDRIGYLVIHMLCLLPGSVHGEVEAVLVDVVVNPEEVLQDVSHSLA